MQPCTWRAFTVGLCTAALVAVLSCRSATKNEESKASLTPLNIVFITLDTVRADHLHCYGDNKIQTPNIDRLAASGTLFEKAVTQTPLTAPSHASMFTGLNPNTDHVRDTGSFVLQPKFVTLATILRSHGWNTAAFISASVLKSGFGFNQGFSLYDDEMSQPGDTFTVATRPASLTVNRALAWLNTQPRQPFMIWLHLFDAHEPYHLPEEFREQYPNDPYDAEIAFEDQQLGRFLDAVKTKSPANKTLYVLLSDHGEGLGDHGEYNHGVFLYDSTVRIAWIMAGPGVPAGIRIRQQARTIDVLPTILDLLGSKSSSAVQGTSMVPAFAGRQVPTTYSYEETLYPKINMDWAELRGIHTASWMYVRAPRPELYDLDQDPGELNNVIDSHPREYRKLEQQLKLLSRLGKNETEIVATNQMNQKTLEQLQSLGYVGGGTEHNIVLDGHGIDPKDRVGVLKLIHDAIGSGSDQLPVSRKIDLLRQGISENPTIPILYYALSNQYEQIGRSDLALQTSLDALHHGIKNPILLSWLGALYLAKGDAAQAVSYYQQVLQNDPLDVEAKTGLANAYASSGQVALAHLEFQQVLGIRQYAPAYTGMGLLAVKLQDFVGARKDFERATQIDPHYVNAFLNLGVLCMHTGDSSCARAAFNTFLANASSTESKGTILQVHNALIALARKR